MLEKANYCHEMNIFFPDLKNLFCKLTAIIINEFVCVCVCVYVCVCVCAPARVCVFVIFFFRFMSTFLYEICFIKHAELKNIQI